MKRTGSIIAGVILTLLLAGAVFALSRKSNTADNSATDTPATTSQTSTNNSSTEETSSTPSSETTTAAATITYSNSGFSPSKITVKTGDTVAVKNTSSAVMQFDSDPHPSHTDEPELNINLVSPGKTMTFTVTKKGTWGYHNHLNASETGVIVVQ